MKSSAAFIFLAASPALALNTDSQRLYQFDGGIREWKTIAEIDEFHHERVAAGELGLGFVDVTDPKQQVVWGSDPPAGLKKRKGIDFPTEPQQQDIVKPLVEKLSEESMTDFLAGFTNYTDRYYTSEGGVDAMLWLGKKMVDTAAAANYDNFEMAYFEHDFPQTSPIGRIVGSEFPEQVIIVSAHADSVRDSPGADDDGSGVANYFEVFKVLVESGYAPRRTVEFIGWAAEEVGLRGSNDISADYSARGVDVIAVYHNEMSGYEGGAANRQIILLDDFVDPELTDLNEKLVEEYCAIPAKRSICGYGCSDHAGWTQRGYAATCTAEAGPRDSGLNPFYHTRQDTIDKLDMSYSLEFSKLALAFVVEVDLA